MTAILNSTTILNVDRNSFFAISASLVFDSEKLSNIGYKIAYYENLQFIEVKRMCIFVGLCKILYATRSSDDKS